ncbi:uncharacterized protein BHQ10_004395 [Talaromyces amestolkiae]|uniref:Uncharacterized protein n=1 Tax=Talaromyces amestolkiae TaxID=1196081 RepID=A0A364KXU4_TALAM|nr:uncharacterized protein BHQ10_004395 [Talaromyces amestolkiae]RAO68383.1 hypothetical protein BHQ10_004395 [Talaromyces amestolkiae]
MVDSDTLPENPGEWHTLIARHGLEKSTIHTVDLASASKIGLDQFLLLRVLWKEHRGRKDLIKFLGLQHWMREAQKELLGLQSWSKYCSSFGAGERIPEGTFAIVRHYQLEATKTDGTPTPTMFDTPIARRTRGQLFQQVQLKMRNTHLSTPTPKSTNVPENWSYLESDDEDEPTPYRVETPVPRELVNIMYPPTKDEQIVNTALIVLLNALTIHLDSFSSKWTLHRKAFIATFGDAAFEARTDGYLNDHRGKPSVIVEVKPVMRSAKLSAIMMQESAQMVAWIKSDDYKTQRNCMMRLHISLFVNVAKCDDAYLDHLNNARPSSEEATPSFLTMHQFGPWDTLNAAHMKELGPILLAISLLADYESKHRKD